ncbi:hypothetical protein E5Q_06039 [Mixia osmundae IAM 14324]|uniref:Uncharacterized protein n=1 Tax=Mixia osmundae (strain CBS 9802 / IAM 14324 / JCM 22182 / KY 12970) TaxID=764103 RepID=G7E9M5_MIXOS|nr:hypothetical protein E5Q_06039 [Mixia osmundae IAM 14324]
MPTEPARASDVEVEDIILAARYGDLDDLKAFVEAYGPEALISAQDDNGNLALHMASANGHVEIVRYLVSLSPDERLAQQNQSGNTPLHWASLNGHLEVLKLLCPRMSVASISLHNKANKTALQEAEEQANERTWMCAGHLLSYLNVEDKYKEEPTADGLEENAEITLRSDEPPAKEELASDSSIASETDKLSMT